MKRYALLFTILLIVLFCLTIADIVLGSLYIPVYDLLSVLFNKSTNNQYEIILWQFRIPKMLTAIIAGIALSVSGLQMQTLFRNPLAGPDVLGISAGAILSVAIFMLCFSVTEFPMLTELSGSFTIAIVACIGASMVLFLIFFISLRIKDIMTILILGILFGSISVAIVSILQYFSNASMLKVFVVWTMGSLNTVTYSQLVVLIPFIIIGVTVSFFSIKTLDAFLLGENYAKTMGVNIAASRTKIFISTSILTGSITAFCGPIGFIGVIVPHIARILFKTASHKIIFPASLCLGPCIMLFSDIISQLPGSGITLPINAITSLIGIPCIMWIIIKKIRIVV